MSERGPKNSIANNHMKAHNHLYSYSVLTHIKINKPGVVAHAAFDPSTRESEAGGFPEFEVSLVFRVSSRTAGATQRNPVWKKQKRKNQQPNTQTQSKTCRGLHNTAKLCKF